MTSSPRFLEPDPHRRLDHDERPPLDDLLALVHQSACRRYCLRYALAELAERIEVAFIFGSVARGEDRVQSDLDLFVIGEVSLQDVVAAISPLQQTLGRDINPVVYPVEELRSKLEDGHHFLTSVLADEKIFVVGTQDELGELLA